MVKVFRLPDDHPYNLKLLELNSKGPIKPLSSYNEDYMRRNELGFYNNFNDINGNDHSSWISRDMACKTSPYVVALSWEGVYGKQCCSGILVEYKGTKTILTSTYIAFGAGYPFDIRNLESFQIQIVFPDRKKAVGKISHFDEFHSIALIDADLASYKAAYLYSLPPDPDVEVLAMGRNLIFGLMASRGKIIYRNDKLASDDLLCCSCTISESGIGGPVIDSSRGLILGMSVYLQNKSTLLMPTTILIHCLDQLLEFGRVMRPSFGVKTRSLRQLEFIELERFYQCCLDGILVKKVIRGSPGEKAGIHVGDIIFSCNHIHLSSPVELADLLLSMGQSHSRQEERSIAIKVDLLRPSTGMLFDRSINCEPFTPNSLNKWPVLPLEVGKYNNCEIVLFSSQVENCEAEYSHQNVKKRTQEVGFSDGLHGIYCSSYLKTRNGLSSIFHDIEQTESSSLPYVTDVIENVESTRIGSEISGVEMLGEPVCSTSISDTLFGNGLTTTSESTCNILQGDDPKTDDIWNPEKLQSKFTCWYQEGSSISSINGPVRNASVLTCEELEQSMLLEIGGDHSRTHSFEKERVLQPVVFSGLPYEAYPSCSSLVHTTPINQRTTWLHPPHSDPQIKITPLDAVIHGDAPMYHQFSTNMDCPFLPC